MTTGDPDLDRMLEGDGAAPPVGHSVFQSVDQQVVLERLNSFESEEATDGYFDQDFLAGQAASTSSLDLGIRTLLTGGGAEEDAVQVSTPAWVHPGVPADPEAARAFVLGGPSALAG
jgi:hypothetical protein